MSNLSKISNKNIMIPVQCSDVIVDVEYNILRDYYYFSELLEKIPVLVEKTYTNYIYRIPCLEVECSSQMFNILLKDEIKLRPYKEKDIDKYDNLYNGIDLIDLLCYNQKYHMLNISYATWGFCAEDYFYLFLYIEKLFNGNPYVLIQESLNCTYSILISYNMKNSEFKLTERRILDVLEYGKIYIDTNFNGHISNSNYPNSLFKFMKNCYDQGFFTFFIENNIHKPIVLKNFYETVISDAKRCPSLFEFYKKNLNEIMDNIEILSYVNSYVKM